MGQPNRILYLFDAYFVSLHRVHIKFYENINYLHCNFSHLYFLFW